MSSRTNGHQAVFIGTLTSSHIFHNVIEQPLQPSSSNIVYHRTNCWTDKFSRADTFENVRHMWRSTLTNSITYHFMRKWKIIRNIVLSFAYKRLGGVKAHNFSMSCCDRNDSCQYPVSSCDNKHHEFPLGSFLKVHHEKPTRNSTGMTSRHTCWYQAPARSHDVDVCKKPISICKLNFYR